eukprot:4877113-Amphidinium_carterae.1
MKNEVDNGSWKLIPRESWKLMPKESWKLIPNESWKLIPKERKTMRHESCSDGAAKMLHTQEIISNENNCNV